MAEHEPSTEVPGEISNKSGIPRFGRARPVLTSWNTSRTRGRISGWSPLST